MMNDNRWIINRAGLINFWYYDEEIFDFSDGRLLLRGSNGSGKSVTMQSFIPLLLDGNKSPERLDPFGSRARRLENYLLGEDENSKDENTAYLFMEFKKKESENFITIGMGMKAAKGKPLQSWGFSITDGRRIGDNFRLYKSIGDKVPLTKKELDNRIAGGGQVCDSAGDYMKMVNNLLFGYEDSDEYDELIKLLVQLRTPKLSKDFKPTVVYEIMENSLQPLSEDDLRPMSEAIENMDNIKSRLEMLRQSKKASDKIKNVYDRYNNYVLTEKAKNFVQAADDAAAIEKDRVNCEQKLRSSKEAHKLSEDTLEELQIQLKAAEEKKRNLDVHDSLRLKEKILELEGSISELSRQKIEKDQQLGRKNSQSIQMESRQKELLTSSELHSDNIFDMLSDMEDVALDFAFDEHAFFEKELNHELKNKFNFQFVKSSLKKQSEAITAALRALEKEKLKNIEYDNALKALELSRTSVLAKQKVLDQNALLLQEIKEELIEKVYIWNRQNLELKVTDENLVQISRAINGFSNDVSFDDILSWAKKDLTIYESSLNRKVYHLQSLIDNIKIEQQKLRDELVEWKNKKDPEPQRESKVLLNRKRLEDRGIPFVPLYKAIDFTKDTSEDMKGIIEEALIEMSLIDALVVPIAYRKQVLDMDISMADKYIFAEPKFMMHNLSEMVKVDTLDVKNITFEDVDNVLKGILIDKTTNNTFIDENGEFGLGILGGRVSRSYVPKYIGSQARRRYREEIISKLNETIAAFDDAAKDLNHQIEALNERLTLLKNEFAAFPRKLDLMTAINELSKAQFAYDRAVEETTTFERNERSLYEELKFCRQQIHGLTRNIHLKPDLEIFENAQKAFGRYNEMLYTLEREHSMLLQSIEKSTEMKLQMEDLLQDIDNIGYDITSIRRKTMELTIGLNNCLEQLKLSDYEQIKQEIEECLNTLSKVPDLIINETRKSERSIAESNRYSNELATMHGKLELARQLLEIYRAAFQEDLVLGFVISRDESSNLLDFARKFYKQSNLDEKLVKDDYVKVLFERFQENSQYLREYILSTGNLFESDDTVLPPLLQEAKAKGRRIIITAKVRGKDVSFYDLLEFIAEGIDETDKLLKESDRQLFEDILVKNISKKIRAKIYHSEQWVKKMNQLMEEMNTSSGLSFSLKWSSKKAETEEQLDTSELVDLLKQEGTLMKESDLNKLSEHFRSKILEARRLQEENGKSQSFHGIMREILDYRKWFEFKLFYVKTGHIKKELTNNAFFQFSGGEKAMAMYVPLFSAVYARYQGARNDCPRLISLDEAFAGVDETNIRDMFRLLKELNLDFLINSQILWGDYDTVPSLAISELIRPDNANFVTVIRYLWNGSVKELVT